MKRFLLEHLVWTKMKVKIEVPQLLRFFDDPNERVAMLHPPVDCRIMDTVLTMALDRVQSRAFSHTVIHASSTTIDLIHFRIKATWKFLGLQKHKVSEGIYAYTHTKNGSCLWIGGNERIPSDTVHYVYALDAHLLNLDMTQVYQNAIRYWGVGSLANTHHWFYRYCFPAATAEQLAVPVGGSLLPPPPSCSVHRFPMPDVTGRWPTLATQGLTEADPYFRRHMLLEDVPPNFNTRFRHFAKTRLFIRTDKPMKALTPHQQRHAEGQMGTPVVPFDLSTLQKRYIAYQRMTASRTSKQWYIVLKYRRGGITTVEQAKSFMCVSTRPRSVVTTLAHTIESTQRIFRMVATMHEMDPQALKAIGESKRQLELANGSLFFIGTAGGRGFRGDTLQRVHGSEVAKWCEGPNQAQLVDELAGGFLGAASHGEVVLESTPNGREWFYNCYTEAKAGQNEFTPIFLPWFTDSINRLWVYDEEEIRDTLAPDEEGLIEKYGLDFGQIAWRRQQKRTYKRLFIQEMPEDDVSCFLTSGICFFDTELLLAWMEKNGPDEHGVKRTYGGGYEVRWKEPIAGHKYVAGVDTSEGLAGGDLNGVGVLDKNTGEQVAAIHGRYSPRELAEHAVRICVSYNNALLAVERENHGHAVLQKVEDLGYRTPHFRGGVLYYFQKGKDIKASRPGWSTNSITRPVMLDNLADAINDGSLIINDRSFVDECLSFRRQHNGKFEADSGAHDDQVMKWGIAWAMIQERQARPRITLVDTPLRPTKIKTPKKPEVDAGVTVRVNVPTNTNGGSNGKGH